MKLFLLLFLTCQWSIMFGQHNAIEWELASNQPSHGRLYERQINEGYLKGRIIHVWVPTHYSKSKKSYNVIYFHDGQMLFDSTITWNHQSWDLDKAMNEHLRRRKIILVGIDNNPTHRYAEFFPSPIYAALPTSVQLTLRDSLWNGLPRFDIYANALITDVFPLIETSWNVNRGGQYGTMAGSSMGAIVSLSFLLTRPHELNGVACLSMHLPLINEWQFKDRFKEPLATAFNQFVREKGNDVIGKKVYIDRGDLSLDAAYAPYFPAFEESLNPMRKNNHVWLRLIPNSGHLERDWAKRIGSILKLVTK